MFKVNNRNTRMCEICSKLTIKTPERRSGIFIVNFENSLHLVLVFLFDWETFVSFNFKYLAFFHSLYFNILVGFIALDGP